MISEISESTRRAYRNSFTNLIHRAMEGNDGRRPSRAVLEAMIGSHFPAVLANDDLYNLMLEVVAGGGEKRSQEHGGKQGQLFWDFCND